MSDETPKSCSSCGKRLNSNNTKDTCSKCRVGKRTAPREAKAARTVAAPPSDGKELERFKVVATALGFDPDELIAQFAAEWLEQLRDKVGAE